MPQLIHALPKYQHHKASGQAVVTIEGKDIYLGPHGSDLSKAPDERVVGEYLVGGRRLPSSVTSAEERTIAELLAAYLEFARGYYADTDGRPTTEFTCLKDAMRPLRRLYGDRSIGSFRLLALKTVRQEMIERG